MFALASYGVLLPDVTVLEALPPALDGTALHLSVADQADCLVPRGEIGDGRDLVVRVLRVPVSPGAGHEMPFLPVCSYPFPVPL